MTEYLESIHHVQLAAPVGGEEKARRFYKDILGFTEVEKPAQMRANGGCWFEQGSISLHIGIETPFVPAERAHPALYTSHLEDLAERLQQYQIDVEFDTRYEGYKRFYVYDPFRNRIEILQRES
ncbi:VOC family protein [Alkalicoccobacillus porphyridii]|uniref:Glyoxalase n=1 Tax=Alkalicoccobacillus porphyridii TaxID=2597270 RepID=A0A553ZXG3_9BACI|nr:VOC family protein [Alkalicoccobacillus porphyridii]TSB46140.1 glyoxalase [Alkalicoccobacillus porphyridii]